MTGPTRERIVRGACLTAVALPLAALAWLVVVALWRGAARLDWALLSGTNHPDPDLAGLLPDLVGSLVLIAMTALIAAPISVGAAIYLNEFGRHRRHARWLEILIGNLAAVPPVVYGLVGLSVFVRTLGLGRSLLAGALTLAMVVLPTLCIAALEALRTVPNTVREGGLALGATRFETVRRLVLPAAAPGILTGGILALGRALGEGAALVVLGGFAYLSAVPVAPTDPLAARPLRLFFWATEPSDGHLRAAAAGVMVLLVVLLGLGVTAAIVRHRAEKRLR